MDIHILRNVRRGQIGSCWPPCLPTDNTGQNSNINKGQAAIYCHLLSPERNSMNKLKNSEHDFFFYLVFFIKIFS